MTISETRRTTNDLKLTLAGRLDSAGAEALRSALAPERLAGVRVVELELGGVNYLSSSALRVLLATHKLLGERGGGLRLVAVSEYCRSVLEIAGFGGMFGAGGGAAGEGESSGGEAARQADWSRAETVRGEWGTLRFLPGANEPGFVEIAGDIMDVLAARVTPGHLFSKRFSEKAYSIGLGGLGDRLDEYFTLMGEMITIGGTMVWLPCDGNDRPDFLIPQRDRGQVLLRTGFNASLAGAFNEQAEFTSAHPEGITMSELYRLLFDQAKARRRDYRGVIGLAMRAEMPAVFGAGVVRAPVAPNAPANGKLITDPSNFPTWFEFDREPRHRGVTGLIAGCGIDLTTDIGGLNRECLERTFYVNPANRPAGGLTLHNHVVMFDPLPMPADGFTLESEIASVVARGEFRDMRHMLDASTVARAVIGLIYAQDFRADADCIRG
ncbi:MAG TPA: STAS domain-containing protein [Opitutus sp.]|nr:STAS domain-containing protein [Opitutus sp.]